MSLLDNRCMGYPWEPGHRYRVEFDDCCIAGEFEALVVLVDRDGGVVLFDNGLTLTRAYGHALTVRELE